MAHVIAVNKRRKWTPSSKPPKRFEQVLVYYPSKDYGCKYVVDYNESSDLEVTHFAQQRRFGNPSHWFPLPPPPGL